MFDNGKKKPSIIWNSKPRYRFCIQPEKFYGLTYSSINNHSWTEIGFDL